MSVKEFHLIKELTYSRLTAICAFELPRFLPTSCANHYLNHVFTSSMVVLILRLFSETLSRANYDVYLLTGETSMYKKSYEYFIFSTSSNQRL